MCGKLKGTALFAGIAGTTLAAFAAGGALIGAGIDAIVKVIKNKQTQKAENAKINQ